MVFQIHKVISAGYRITRCMRLTSLAQIIQGASRCSATFGTSHDTETVVRNHRRNQQKEKGHWAHTLS